jgi:hypothetical protein
VDAFSYFVLETSALAKIAKEYAPGIPNKEALHPLPSIKSPITWEYGLHEHHARKRGLHYDLRLGDPKTGHAHSWALNKELPDPGKQMWAIQQPTHTTKYMDFEGDIPSGYGAGKVVLKDRAKTEITKAEPGYVSFNIYRSTGPEEYSLRHMGGKVWRLSNKTINKTKHPTLPDYKPAYKEVSVDKIPLDDMNQIMSAKIDDAHNLFYFPAPNEQIRVLSYRPSKRSPTGLIEHTHKVERLFGKKTPKSLAGTIVRGGLYAMHPSNDRATEAHILGGMLNSDVWKSREKQKEHGSLIPVLYDVVSYKNKNLENAPYNEKLKVLREIQKEIPEFELPKMAFTPDEKKELLQQIRSGRLAHTKEGVVLWNATNKATPAIKAKFRNDHDVYIRGFFPGEGRLVDNGVGGFLYSHDRSGPLIGRVGTGLSDAQRKDMYKNPEKYIGIVAKVEAQGKFEKTKSLRAPSFIAFHLDKNPQDKLDRLRL